MRTEYHCHILPGIDDGSDSAETSRQMIALMQAQGIERICATPHFYAHRERSVARFLEKRQEAFAQISGTGLPEIHLGAEVAIERGISELPGIEQLAIEGTRILLLEFPYRPYEKWMSEEIYNIATEFHLKIMLAHVHRCLEYCSRDDMETILHSQAIYQLNNEAFGSWKESRFAKRVIAEHTHFAFGSDAHDMKNRKPNWDLLQKKVKPDAIAVSDTMFEKYQK
ncbi:MAG: capsular polysaccharide biosynthesis protein [Oscillospiraceae bacterium]|nr:capsular polysaccharide biosynthesis protein [Oscillospiraceae bacterium]